MKMISIIIPSLNAHDMTEDCILAVIKNTADPFEIVLIDNGSIPPYSIEAAHGRGIIIRNETNTGFPCAVNQGIRQAKGDVIVLLNNDVIITPGALNRLASWLDTYSITAPVANYCAGLQQEIILPAYDNIEELNDRVAELAEERKGESIEVNFVMGFCMAFRKSLFDEIGPFDESLWPCCGEEIDFCFKAREAGHKIGVAHDAYVHHIGSVTLAEMERNGQIGYLETCKKNDAHLAKKWGDDFWGKQVGPYKKENPEISGNGALRLNLGCGRYPISGFVNIDQFENVNPDLVTDALNLPYEIETVDEIYAGHLLEHLTWDEGQNALRHWLNLLKKGGIIRITVPDFDVLARKYLSSPTAEAMRRMNELYIYSYCQESHHRYCYGEELLKAAMTEAGFISLEKVPQNHPYFTSAMDDQISFKGVK